jgi:hypothetical protein
MTPAIPDGDAIAAAIVKIGDAMKTLDQSRLKRETIVILLQARTGLPKKEISAVLDGLVELESIWLKPAKK